MSLSKIVRCAISSLVSSVIYSHLICRAFNEILKVDRATYGAGEDYVIADTIADEWQQRVDDVVAGEASVV